MKVSVTAAALCGIALGQLTPASTTHDAPQKLPWLEMDFDEVVKLDVKDISTQPEKVQGTYLYCKAFDLPAEPHPPGNYASTADCRAKHFKSPFLPENSALPCNKETGYQHKNCGTLKYCLQYAVEGDRPKPHIHDDAESCFDFHEPGPAV